MVERNQSVNQNQTVRQKFFSKEENAQKIEQLHTIAAKMCKLIDPQKEPDSKSILKNLEFIENKLHYLIEGRDYNVIVS